MFTITLGYTLDAQTVYMLLRLVLCIIGATCALIAIIGHIAGGAR